MPSLRTSYAQWSALAAAAVLWAGVVYFGLAISEEFDARVQREQEAQQEMVRKAAAIRLHALAADTADERAKLQAIAAADAVTLANTVDQVSKDSGVRISIAQAMSSQQPGGAKGALLQLHPVSFALDAEGSLAALFKAASLLSQLPIPSTLDAVQFSQVRQPKAGTAALWHLTVRMRFFTMADLSS